LHAYYSGKLSDKEKNALERKAMDDPFLYEAMEGFEEVPGSFKEFYTKHSGKSSTSRILFIGIGALALLFIISYSLNRVEGIKVSEKVVDENSVVATDTLNFVQKIEPEEVEQLSPAVQILKNQPKAKQVEKAELISNNDKKVALADQSEEKEDIIEGIMDDEIPFNVSQKLEQEPKLKTSKRAVPSVYLFDLYTVDYRRIKRSKTEISYTRFELGGVSADRENEQTADSPALIETEVKIPYFNYLQKTMAYFADASYKNALNRYLIILEQYPNDLNALFYGGLSYYNLGDYTSASELFQRIARSDLAGFHEEAMWYQCKTEIQLGKTKAAISGLDNIIIEGGFYTKDAINLKNELMQSKK
jgi:TolA-binding protein